MDLFTASIQSSYVDFPVSIVLAVYFIKTKKKKSSYVKKKNCFCVLLIPSNWRYIHMLSVAKIWDNLISVKFLCVICILDWMQQN